MKQNNITILIFLLLNLMLIEGSGQEFKCTLKGSVVDRESKELLLLKATEDTRNIGTTILIVDGNFEYDFIDKNSEAYQLVFKDELDKGIWKPIIFFPEEGMVNFTLYPAEKSEKNQVRGGALNAEHRGFQQSILAKFIPLAKEIESKMKLLKQSGEFYSDTANSILEQIKTIDNDEKYVLQDKLREMGKDHLDKSPKAKMWGEKMDSLSQEYFNYRSNYIYDNPSIVSYYLLYEEARALVKDSGQYGKDILSIRKNYIRLSKAYPDHPYTHTIGQMIESYETVKIGGEFIDFEAPDLEGNPIKVSDEISGKIALLDLWASWCGPCIKKSRTMVPVYEEYKDKGFMVLGVAREFDDTGKLKKALEREKFPWLNLVELDDQNKIWLKYNIPFSGGGIFLIDENGKILAVNPTSEEVRIVLEERL